MSKLLLIDGNAILHRAFHALPPLTSKRGEPINAVYGFVTMLLKAIQDLDPTHIAVCFDEKEKTFRHIALPTYQSQRPPTAEDLSSQFEKAKDFLEAAGIPVYSKSGFEADDVIGTIASKTSTLRLSRSPALIDEVVIVTGDRDILQLVNRRVKLYMPVAGLSSAKLFGEAETLERMGVASKLIPDYKGLVGDASDNYFGVPGVGPKTAINLIREFGSFKGIYKNLSKIPEKLRGKLEKNRKSAELSYKLATIMTDVPIEIDLNSMQNWDVDSSEVLDLFVNKFGFRTLTERVKKVGQQVDQEKQMTLI